jgi:hypothetical protein
MNDVRNAMVKRPVRQALMVRQGSTQQMHLTTTAMGNSMKLWSRSDKEQREPAKSVRVGASLRRLALLTFPLSGPFATPMQGYQSTLNESLTCEHCRCR